MRREVEFLLEEYEAELLSGASISFKQFLKNMTERKHREKTEFEARTQEFFGQSPAVLARQLKGRVVELDGTNKKIVLVTLESWRLAENGAKRYEPMQQMEPGDFWAANYPFRRMRQSLIVAQDSGKVGACVRIINSARFDPKTGDFVQMEREGETANYLGMRDDQVLQLKFADNSNTLHLVRKS